MQTEARKYESLGQEKRTLSREEAGADAAIGSLEVPRPVEVLAVSGSPEAVLAGLLAGRSSR